MRQRETLLLSELEQIVELFEGEDSKLRKILQTMVISFGRQVSGCVVPEKIDKLFVLIRHLIHNLHIEEEIDSDFIAIEFIRVLLSENILVNEKLGTLIENK